ncbi:MAG TPA: aspartate aminotransferase family protein [Bacillota bacterium]
MSTGTPVRYPDPNSRSAQLFRRAQRVLPGGNTRTTVLMDPYPLYAQEGHGCWVTDVDGVRRLDFINNYTSLIHGHAHPEIVRAVQRQVERGSAFALPTESEIELAEALSARVKTFERIRFTNSGTEAVMMAIKAARAYTGRSKIAKCEGCYHGAYDYVEVSLTSTPANWGEPDPQPTPYADGTPATVLGEVVVLPFNDAIVAERLLRRHGHELAAVIVDPMPNRAGLMPADPEFLATLRRLTREIGAVLILDEVITFRLGPGGAQGEFGVEPDLTTLGKIIGGGFPVGAVAGRAEVMRVFEPSSGRIPLPHGGTFNANPVTMAAGLAAMRLWTPDAIERLNHLGDLARRELTAVFQEAGVPGQVSGRGSLLRLHMTDRPLRDYRSAYPDEVARRRLEALFRHLLNDGILLSPTGLMALSTPMGEAEIEQLVAAVRRGLERVAQIT